MCVSVFAKGRGPAGGVGGVAMMICFMFHSCTKANTEYVNLGKVVKERDRRWSLCKFK